MSEQAPNTGTTPENVGQGDTATTNPPAESGKVDFSPEQQDWINNNIGSVRKENKALQNTIEQLSNKLAQFDPESLNNRLEAASKKDDKDTQIELLMQEISNRDNAIKENTLSRQINDSINGVKPNMHKFVESLVREQLQVDDNGALKVVNVQTGAQRFSADGTRPLEVKDVVAEIIRDYPEFGVQTSGSGVRPDASGPANSGGDILSQMKNLNVNTAEGYAKYQELVAAAKKQ